MADPHALDNPDVCALLDILFADKEDRDPAPDWAAIESRLFQCQDSLYSVARDLMRAMWALYEDEAAFDSALYQRSPFK